MLVIHASLFAALTAVFVVQANGDNLKTVHLSEICPIKIGSGSLRLDGTSRSFNSSVTIKTVPDTHIYNTNINCSLDVIAPPGHNIVASVRQINLRGNCYDNLTLSNGDEYRNYLYCGTAALDTTETTSMTFVGHMIIKFITGNGSYPSTSSYRGFQLTVTAYTYSPCSSSSEFRCGNNRCIAKELRCDGHNHCGDRSDQLQCSSTCSPDRFRCMNGQCIRSLYVCDGDRDCLDGSDEMNCASTCSPDRFRCMNGQCITSSFVCDGDRDCLDGSDEMNCATCSLGRFRCLNGQCISSSFVCDGDRDCSDGSDEINCATCSLGRFHCQNGQCIKSWYVCDGYRHCSDGTDEINCGVPGVVVAAITAGTLGLLTLFVGVIVWLRKRSAVTRGTVIHSHSAPSMVPAPSHTVVGPVPLLPRVDLLYQTAMPTTLPSGDLQVPSHKEIHQETKQPPPYS